MAWQRARREAKLPDVRVHDLRQICDPTAGGGRIGRRSCGATRPCHANDARALRQCRCRAPRRSRESSARSRRNYDDSARCKWLMRGKKDRCATLPVDKGSRKSRADGPSIWFCGAKPFALPETRVTLHSGHIGNTSGLWGDQSAVAGVLQNGRTSAVCSSIARW